MKTIWGILAMSTAMGLFGCASDGSWNTAQGWSDRSDKMQTASDNLNGSASGNGNYTANNTSSTYNSGDSSLNASYGRTDLNARTDANGGARATSSNQVPDTGNSMAMNSGTSNSGTSGMNSSSDTANYGTHDNQSVARSDANAGAGPQLNDGSDKTKIAAALSDQDRNFMQDAGAGGMYEVQAGEKALAKSSDQRVKNIAQHMVDDHTKANQQLMALARRKGVELAGVPNADQIKMLAQLDKLNGTDFDQEYINQQKQAHQDTIAKFQTEASDGKDRDTRDWAASTLPTLREHLNMINGTTENGLGSNR